VVRYLLSPRVIDRRRTGGRRYADTPDLGARSERMSNEDQFGVGLTVQDDIAARDQLALL